MVSKQINHAFQYLSENESMILQQAAESILGIPVAQLGSEFITEIDSYLSNLPEWLKKEYKQIFQVFNLQIFGLLFIHKLKNFTNMTPAQKNLFVNRFAQTRLPLLRSVFSGLKSICAWGYYSQDNILVDFPGTTLGREHQTPTLLFGKEAWKKNK